MIFLLRRTVVPVWSLAAVTRAATASHTVNGISFAREGHRSVPGAVVRSLAGVCRRCRAATTSSTLSARSVASRCFAVLSRSSRVGLIAVHASYDLVADEYQQRQLIYGPSSQDVSF